MRARRYGIIGGVLLALCLLVVKTEPAQFFSAYLVAYLLWLGISLGAATVWMVHNLVGGRWGTVSLPTLRAASRTIFLMAPLFLPLLFALPILYPWSVPGASASPMTWYLNKPFFYGRASFCFLVWIGVALMLPRSGRPEGLSAVGLLLFAVTISIAAFDWILSLDLSNRSTIFGFLVIVGQFLSALAFTVFMLATGRESSSAAGLTRDTLHDLGNLLLTGVLLWAYLAYSQLIITWSGNMREEVIWYNHRLVGGWARVGLFLLICNFALPFTLLLFRSVKRSRRMMAPLALGLVLMQWVDLVWLIVPSVSPTKMTTNWLHFVVPVAVGALWMAAFDLAWKRDQVLVGHGEG